MACNIYQTVKNSILSTRRITNIVESALQKLNFSRACVSVHLIADARMKKLNTKYLAKNSTTDVLSFSTESAAGNCEECDLGDIFISLPQIRRQAKVFGISEKEEFVRILIHGILHLSGYVHQKRRDSDKMFALQEDLVHFFYE
ncbi:MAG: rRNA maturation RNase YbeY [Patescibacteria group bacterium]